MTKPIFAFLILNILFIPAFCQSFEKYAGETPEQFVERTKPDSSTVVHSVLQTKKIGTQENALMVFYSKPMFQQRLHKPDDYAPQIGVYILGYLFIPQASQKYERILIDTIFPDGGDPEILSVFNVNADDDKEKELAVLCIYEQRHYDYNGAFYETFFYDYNRQEKQFTFLRGLSNQFYGCACSLRDGNVQEAKYKTAKEVKEGLNEMGFKQ